MPVDQKALLEAVSAGVEDADPQPSNSSESESADTEQLDTDESANDSATGESEGNDAGDADSTNEESAEGDATAAEPDKAAAEENANPKAAKPDAAAASKPIEQKAKDPINDPLPPNLKTATRERIQDLIKVAKTATTERDAAITQRNEIMGFIQDSGATPQQYSEALGFIKMLNSGTREGMEQALGVLQKGINQISRQLGKPVAGVDMLEGHNDLREQVQNGLLSLQHAQELAAGRERSKLETQQAQAATQQQRQVSEAQQAIADGRQALNNLEAQLKAADPLYGQKKEILVTALKPVFARLHPSEWAAAFQQAYNDLKIAAPAPKPTTKIPTNLPVRAKQTPGAVRAPANLLDAVSQGIAQAGGR